MKKIILLLAVFCSMSFGQGWNTTVQTSINEPNVEKMDLASNASGVHVLIKRTNGNIVYYNLNSSGVVDGSKTATLQTNGDFPNIVASNDIVYALYKTGNVIRARYSTNGGSSWIWNSSLDRTTTANLCNGIDAVYQDQLGIHLVWATRDDNPNFKTYYSRLRPSDHQWVEFQNVTSHTSAFYGGNPTVTFSAGCVHVGFNTDDSDQTWTPGDAKTRDRLNGVWQTPQTVVSGSDQSVDEKLLVSGNTLYLFYTRFISGDPITNDLVYRTRSVSGTTWSSPVVLKTSIFESGNAFSVAKTVDNNIHVIYMSETDEQNEGLGYRSFNGSSWSSPIVIGNNLNKNVNPGFTNVSNDLFLTWKQLDNGYVRFKQYDAAPLAPQNYAVSVYQSGNNKYPKLTWLLNNEPDVRNKTSNAYKIERRTRNSRFEAWSAWSNIANLAGTISTYIDYSINTAGGGDKEAEYRITAIDVENNQSPQQSVVIIYGMGGLDKISSVGNIIVYELSQNYPNPFNPSTSINYQIKEKGFVSLKIYDMLGEEIATLVSETKDEGQYSVEFNANSLPSGVYIYSLRVNDFVQNNKMTLLK